VFGIDEFDLTLIGKSTPTTASCQGVRNNCQTWRSRPFLSASESPKKLGLSDWQRSVVPRWATSWFKHGRDRAVDDLLGFARDVDRADLRHLHDHVRGRFDICRRWFMPWLRRFLDLNLSDVVEIGCGTGSTTAALALAAREVDAYDIAGASVEAARIIGDGFDPEPLSFSSESR
jgi:SAM-dependent methyltransferase